MKMTGEVDANDNGTLGVTVDELSPLLERVHSPHAAPTSSILVGTLLGISQQGGLPLLSYPGQPSAAAVLGRTVVDLHAGHIDSQVLLAFEDLERKNPIVIGVLRSAGWPLEQRPDQVLVDADGERLIITAHRQLVLRCGKASITLSEDGEVKIKGTHLSSHSSGVNRIKGGSVELN
jgi:hypothetical protein